MTKLALQADLWYNNSTKLLTSAMLETSARLRRICIGDASMDTLPPHAPHGNIPTAPGIYKITCTANKKIYIGSAINLRQRRTAHFRTLRQNKHHNRYLQRAFNKYGPDAFTFEVLELVLPMSLTAREQYWFKQLKPFGRKGFNVALVAGAPNSNRKDSPETIEKKRQAHLGRTKSPEHREKLRQSALGKKRSPETVEKLRQTHLGHLVSAETREKIRKGYGPHGSEAREKMRQAKLGKKRSPETIEIMKQAWIVRKKRKES